MKSVVTSLILVLLSEIIAGCSDNNAASSSLEIELAETTKTVTLGEMLSVKVSVKNIDLFEKMLVEKLKGESTVAVIDTITRADLTGNEYVFTYLVAAEDYAGSNLAFRFGATDINGRPTPKYDVSVTLIPYAGLQKTLIPSGLKMIARLTGDTPAGETLPNPNATGTKYNVGGTDLGIMWKLSDTRLGMWFGDSYGKDKFLPDQGATDWRSNVLAFSSDTFLADGLSFDSVLVDNFGSAKQIIYSAQNTSGNGDYTSIPTAAIRLNGVDYVHYMNIRSWGKAGAWLTNYSGYYFSQDNGNTWRKAENILFPGNSLFAQAALSVSDEYVYMLGTPSGRFGSARLARFKPGDILNLNNYEYWNSDKGWQKGYESSSSPLFSGPVGEMSLIYDDRFNRWIVTYLNETKRALVMRDAAHIFGPWSEEKTLVTANQYPGLYGAFIYPLKTNDRKMYFAMSLWGLYNVFLMSVDIELRQ